MTPEAIQISMLVTAIALGFILFLMGLIFENLFLVFFAGCIFPIIGIAILQNGFGNVLNDVSTAVATILVGLGMFILGVTSVDLVQ